MYDKAEEVIKQAISEVPNFAQFYSSLGIMLGRQNRLEVNDYTCHVYYPLSRQLQEGEKLLEKAVTLEPNSGNYHANLGTEL